MEATERARSENTSALRPEIDRLKADLERLRSDVSGLAGDAARATKTGAGEATERIARSARAAAAKGRESMEAVEDQVAAHPLLALGAALAVGTLVGFALSRKD